MAALLCARTSACDTEIEKKLAGNSFKLFKIYSHHSQSPPAATPSTRRTRPAGICGWQWLGPRTDAEPAAGRPQRTRRSPFFPGIPAARRVLRPARCWVAGRAARIAAKDGLISV